MPCSRATAEQAPTERGAEAAAPRVRQDVEAEPEALEATPRTCRSVRPRRRRPSGRRGSRGTGRPPGTGRRTSAISAIDVGDSGVTALTMSTNARSPASSPALEPRGPPPSAPPGHAERRCRRRPLRERLRDLVGDDREAVGGHGRGDAQDHVVRAGGEERPGGLEGLAPGVRGRAARELGGERERRGVAAGGLERPRDLVALRREVGDVARAVARHRPALRVAGRERDAPPLLAAQPDRRPARAHRPGLVGRAAQRVGRVVERHARGPPRLVGEQRRQDPQRALEAVVPLGQRRQRDPERVVLALVPAGAEAQDEPAAGDVVDDGRRLREQGRVAERVRRDRDPDPLARHAVGEGRDRRERLDRRPVRARGRRPRGGRSSSRRRTRRARPRAPRSRRSATSRGPSTPTPRSGSRRGPAATARSSAASRPSSRRGRRAGAPRS